MNLHLKKPIEFISFVFISVAMLIIVTWKFWNPLSPKDYSTILIYLFLLIFINSFPLKIGDIYVTFILAISISVFLEYGIVVEAWLTQISILVSMLISGQRRTIYRTVLSQMMFIWISISAGFVYLFVGGEIGFGVEMADDLILPIILYAMTYFIVNNLLLYLILKGIESSKTSLFSEDVIWDGVTLLLTLPLGVIMYLVKLYNGNYGMLFVAIPIIIITHLFKLYSELHHSHYQLKALNKISASFTSELNLEKTITAIQMAIQDLLSFDFSYIFLVKGDKLKLISVVDAEKENIDKRELDKFNMSLGEGLSGRVALYKKAEIVGNNTDLYQMDNEPDFIKDNKSLLSVPMLWNEQIIGVITLGSLHQYFFSKKDLTLAKILASQAAIAIQNATKYQKTEEKSLIDELTEVYNFRAFEDTLHDVIIEAEMKEQNVSLLMIDLDHFKKINDKFGHATGNVVLKQVALLLKELTRKEDIVFRYGGEEFTIIIPNIDSMKAKYIAERIRESIEQLSIKANNTLQGSEEVDIKVTASIGIASASYPKSTTSAQELVRQADRAMYVGSKQAGRNRVSEYSDFKN